MAVHRQESLVRGRVWGSRLLACPVVLLLQVLGICGAMRCDPALGAHLTCLAYPRALVCVRASSSHSSSSLPRANIKGALGPLGLGLREREDLGGGELLCCVLRTKVIICLHTCQKNVRRPKQPVPFPSSSLSSPRGQQTVREAAVPENACACNRGPPHGGGGGLPHVAATLSGGAFPYCGAMLGSQLVMRAHPLCEARGEGRGRGRGRYLKDQSHGVGV